MRKCSKCKIEKDISEFYHVKSKIFWYCKTCSKKVTVERQHKNKKDAVNYKGGKCLICSYNKCQNTLEFHHLDPEKKDFTIGQHHGKVLESIKSELDKCILLCKNCHSEVHAGLHNDFIKTCLDSSFG